MNDGLSVCVFVGDQVDHLSACIASVSRCADELLLVDTGSNPETASLAEHHRAGYFQTDWQRDFGSLREFGRRKTQRSWAFLIDADEELVNAEGLREKIGNSNKLAFRISRQNLFEPAKLDTFTETEHLRLIRADVPTLFKGRYDPQADVPESETGAFGDGEPVLRHFGLLNVHQLTKLERNLEIIRKDLSDRPNSLDTRIEFGRTLWLLGRLEGSQTMMDCAEAALSLAYLPKPPTRKIAILFEYLLTLPDSDLPYGWNPQTLFALIDKWAPNAPGPRWLQAQRAYQRGDWTSAKKQAEHLVRLGRTRTYDRTVPFHPSLVRTEALFLAGNANLMLGLYNEAEGCFLALLDTEYEQRARNQVNLIMSKRLEMR